MTNEQDVKSNKSLPSCSLLGHFALRTALASDWEEGRGPGWWERVIRIRVGWGM